MSFLIKLGFVETKHLEQVVALDQLCLGGLWTINGYRRELDSPNSTLLRLSLEDEREEIIGIGCFWAILEEAHLTVLAIHPHYRGQGLGQLLLFRLLQNASQQKLERATLEVRESNQAALSLYQKFGFKLAGRRKKYYQKEGEDALVLWRSDLEKPEFISQLKSWQQQVKNRFSQTGWIIES